MHLLVPVFETLRAGFQVRWGSQGAMHSVRLVEAFRAKVDYSSRFGYSLALKDTLGR